MRRTCTALLMLGLTLLGARPGFGDEGSIEAPDLDKTLSPYFFVENGDPELDQLPLKATRAEIHVAGVIADVVVTQVYRNEGIRPINAKYVFPASTRAAVHGMTMQIGERRIKAQIRERQAAKQEFEEAQKAGKSAALLEQQRPNVFTMQVANVLPHDEIEVELHYSELLVPTDGTYELVYPTVVGPRYSSQPEATAPDSDQWVKSPYLRSGEAPTYTFDVETRIAAGMPLEEVACPSHKTLIEWEGANAARVKLDPHEADGANRDYILRYRLAGRQVQTGLLLYPGQPGQDEKFFLLTMQPPQRVAPQEIPPREYIFVVDVSGSMHGFPLDTAKVLMQELIGSLRPTDRFNVILFAGGSRLLAPVSLPATPENVKRALEEILRERGGGGTELGAALTRALELPGNVGVSRSTIVITDGYISAEADAFERIRANLNRSNLFAFGIGSSVNRHLIEGMARAGQGEPFVVTNAAEAKAVVPKFQDYVRSPVLTDIAFEAQGFAAYDVEPASIPDLFADRPLVIFGKWRGKAEGTLRVTGLGGAGTYEDSFDAAVAASPTESPEENRALRYLWARARVASLGDNRVVDDETRHAITTLGLTYELLTRYTSFVAVHEVVRTDGSAETVDQPLPLPQGVSDYAVGVPEPGLPLLIVLALFLLWLLRAWWKE